MGDIIKIEYAKENNITYEEIEAHKPKYRQGLIDLGNWGRSISPDYWLEKIVAQDGNIVVTDVRIKHEYEVFKKAENTLPKNTVFSINDYNPKNYVNQIKDLLKRGCKIDMVGFQRHLWNMSVMSF